MSLSHKIKHFFHSPLAAGSVLIGCTVIALVCSHIDAVAPWFNSIWNADFSIGIGGYTLSHTVKEWINDALMAVFFFFVGLEIKREMVVGQLSTIKQASLPVAAAIGGMLVPALIYVFFNHDNPFTSNGWGIPMATDIAFALGILSMFSKKVPLSLKIFLTALAVVDDLGAIIVIAIFYSSAVNFVMLGLAAALFALLIVFNMCNVLKMKWYLVPAIILWFAFLNSGVHATIAGVLIAMTIPMKSTYSKAHFLGKAKELLTNFVQNNRNRVKVINNQYQHGDLQQLREVTRQTISPVQRLEFALHGPVNFFIMPLFALANAGVVINAAALPQIVSEQGLGIQLGLVLGKPLGIVFFTWLVIKLGIGAKPLGATWRTIIGVGCLGGVGFTMSIFIDMLAFPAGSPYIDFGKMAILSASVIAAILGAVILSGCKSVDSKYHW